MKGIKDLISLRRHQELVDYFMLDKECQSPNWTQGTQSGFSCRPQKQSSGAKASRGQGTVDRFTPTFAQNVESSTLCAYPVGPKDHRAASGEALKRILLATKQAGFKGRRTGPPYLQSESGELTSLCFSKIPRDH